MVTAKSNRNIYFDQDFLERIKKASRQMGLSVSSLVRLALSKYLEEHEKD